MGFQLVSGSLVPLGVGEGGEELVSELGPGISVVLKCEAVIEPFPHVAAPFLDQGALDQGESKRDPGQE